MRRIRFSGKDLEVETQEGTLEAGSAERGLIQHHGQSSRDSQDPGQRKWSRLPGGQLSINSGSRETRTLNSLLSFLQPDLSHLNSVIPES